MESILAQDQKIKQLEDDLNWLWRESFVERFRTSSNKYYVTWKTWINGKGTTLKGVGDSPIEAIRCVREEEVRHKEKT
jgi:hypothetical protein